MQHTIDKVQHGILSDGVTGYRRAPQEPEQIWKSSHKAPKKDASTDGVWRGTNGAKVYKPGSVERVAFKRGAMRCVRNIPPRSPTCPARVSCDAGGCRRMPADRPHGPPVAWVAQTATKGRCVREETRRGCTSRIRTQRSCRGRGGQVAPTRGGKWGYLGGTAAAAGEQLWGSKRDSTHFPLRRYRRRGEGGSVECVAARSMLITIHPTYTSPVHRLRNMFCVGLSWNVVEAFRGGSVLAVLWVCVRKGAVRTTSRRWNIHTQKRIWKE